MTTTTARRRTVGPTFYIITREDLAAYLGTYGVQLHEALGEIHARGLGRALAGGATFAIAAVRGDPFPRDFEPGAAQWATVGWTSHGAPLHRVVLA